MKKILAFLLLSFISIQIQSINDYRIQGIYFDKNRLIHEMQEHGVSQKNINKYFSYVYKILTSDSKEAFNFVQFFPLEDTIHRYPIARLKDKIGYLLTFNQLVMSESRRLDEYAKSEYLSNAVLCCPHDEEGQKVFMGIASFLNNNTLLNHNSDFLHHFAYDGDVFKRGALQIAKESSISSPLSIRYNNVVINKTGGTLKISNEGFPGGIAIDLGIPFIAIGSTTSPLRFLSYLHLGELQGSLATKVGISINQRYTKVVIDNTSISNVAAGIYIQKGVEVVLRNVTINTSGSLSVDDLNRLNLHARTNEKFKTNFTLVPVSNLHNGIYLEEGAILKMQNVTVNGNKLSDTL